MNRDELKQAVCAEIDRRRDDIIGIAHTMRGHPELGYKEVKTAALVRDTLAGLGLPVREGLAITGVDGVLAGGQPGPAICIMGELDSVTGRDAEVCDPETGAAHQCGHHIQVASMLGAAIGLAGSGVAPSLAGRIHFLGAPAEEFLEIEYRLGLANEGKVTYLSGKQELVKLGYFDDIAMAMMVHSAANSPEPGFYFSGQANGFLAKFVRYVGRASHAGASPQDGINALNAACLGILAVHAQRETFRDQDAIRVHPIITKGGDVVNVVPADVRIETFVRGRTVDAILDASKKVDRAFRGGGDAVGAETIIQNVPGYLPIYQDENLTRLAEANGRALLGERGVLEAPFLGGSLDVGDLSHLMPVLHPFVGGAQGALHAADFKVLDYEASAVAPAKLMAMTAIDLLADGAAAAQEISASFRPLLTKTQYLEMMEGLRR